MTSSIRHAIRSTTFTLVSRCCAPVNMAGTGLRFDCEINWKLIDIRAVVHLSGRIDAVHMNVHKNKQDRGERRDSDRFADAESTHVKCVCFCAAVAIEYRYVYPSCINTKSRWTDGDEGGMETEPSGLNNADHVTRIRALWPSLLAEKTLFPHVLIVVTMPGFRPVHCLNGAAARGSCR